MNILLLTGIYDFQPASGGAFLMKAYVEELRRQGHRVFVYYFASADSNPREATKQPDTWYLADLKDGYYARLPLHKKLMGKVKALLGKPAPVTDKLKRYFERDFSWLGPALKQQLKGEVIDVIQVDFPWLMKVGKHLPPGIPKVYVSHEAQFVLYSRNGNVEAAQKCLAYETELAAQYDALLTLTDVEMLAWKQVIPEMNVVVSPMGVQLPNSSKGIAPKATKLVFLGSGKHAPNLDGIRFFLTEIWPIVRQNHKQLEISITGNYAPDFIAEFSEIAGVLWVGFVDDLLGLLWGSISIVPIRQGSGIRVKILESMALGAAVVATPMAAEGIVAEDKEAILLAHTPKNFSDAIDLLLSNDDWYHKIASQAQSFVYKNYDLAITTQKRVQLFETIANSLKP